jgi:hypothetical protein
MNTIQCIEYNAYNTMHITFKKLSQLGAILQFLICCLVGQSGGLSVGLPVGHLSVGCSGDQTGVLSGVSSGRLSGSPSRGLTGSHSDCLYFRLSDIFSGCCLINLLGYW